ncbi:MAG: transcriptional repressor [Rhodobiaceae bacterium]|nr:transcriptional repressor [Rhodobiaceae bacterium]
MSIEELCENKGLRLTEQRRVIAKVLDGSNDHPDVEELHKRAIAIDNNISVATVYRTVRLFEESGILIKHEFGDGRSRYENFQEKDHHDHLIDIESGNIIEFQNQEIEMLQKKIAEELGFDLVDHRLELYARKKQ